MPRSPFLLPILHNHPRPKVYVPLKPISILRPPDLLLHAFPWASLCCGKALSQLCICGNPTHPDSQLSKIIMNIDYRARLPRFKSQLCHLWVVWLWANHLVSICLNFLICKTGIIMYLCKVNERVTRKFYTHTQIYVYEYVHIETYAHT